VTRDQTHTRGIIVIAASVGAVGWLLWMRSAAPTVEARTLPAQSQQLPTAAAGIEVRADPTAAPEAHPGEPAANHADSPTSSAVASLARLEEFSMVHSDSSRLPPVTLLENLRSAFRQYHSRFGGNPVGTNLEITRALNGDNPGRAMFLIEEDGMRMNELGELVDTWDTPFFFHQLSGTEMEIHSAGPDRRMGTPDDSVLR
jgi:hypothetical protein